MLEAEAHTDVVHNERKVGLHIGIDLRDLILTSRHRDEEVFAECITGRKGPGKREDNMSVGAGSDCWAKVVARSCSIARY